MTEEPKRQEKKAQEPEESNLWDKIKEYFLDKPTLALTLLYLYLTAIGMFYSLVLYGNFGINIFDYSEIPDFILAAFKNPVTLITGCIYLALFYSALVFSRRLSRIEQETGHELFIRSVIAYLQLFFIVSLFVLPLMGGFWSAQWMASSIKDGKEPTVDIRYRSFSSSAGQVKERNLRLIGTTQKAVFFYDVDPKPKRTIVIPQAQLVSIEVPEKD